MPRRTLAGEVVVAEDPPAGRQGALDQRPALVELAAEHLEVADREVETAALVYSDDALGRALRATFEAAAADVGLQVVSVPATTRPGT